jgi:hypothetical protein
MSHRRGRADRAYFRQCLNRSCGFSRRFDVREVHIIIIGHGIGRD